MKEEINVFKKLREELSTVETDYTQKMLSISFKKLGFTVSQKTISEAEKKDLINGKYPSLYVIMAYSKRFNVTTDYLLGLSENSSTDIDYVGINRITGLKTEAIKCLEMSHSKNDYNMIYSEKGYPNHIVSTINFLLENEDTKVLIEYLYLYLFGNYTYINGKKSFAIELSDNTRLGRNGIAIPIEEANIIFISIIIDILPKIRKAHENDSNYFSTGKKKPTKKELIEAIEFFSSLNAKSKDKKSDIYKEGIRQIEGKKETLKELYGIEYKERE